MDPIIPGQRVAFAYEHQYRVLDVEVVRETEEGNWIMTGIDPDKGEYRSFRLDRVMRGKVRVVRGNRAGNVSRPAATAAQDAHDGGAVPPPR